MVTVIPFFPFNLSFNSFSNDTRFFVSAWFPPRSVAAGYSQSISIPSNPYLSINSAAESINAFLLDDELAISENGFPPTPHPPTAMYTFRSFFLDLRAMVWL